MAYIPTEWECGDVVTAEKMNKIEEGIRDASALNIVNGSAENSLRTTGSLAEDENYTMGVGAFAEGGGTQAIGMYSHAEGGGTRATGNGSHTEGGGCQASGNYAHAEGGGSSASGNNSHAEGTSQATADASHAEGGSTKAYGSCSHSEGGSCIAAGVAAHAEGQTTQATGASAHSEGGNTVASGACSHAEGGGTLASFLCQHVFGEFNVADSSENPPNMRGNYIEIVGNGTANNARSNARTLDWSGNESLKGSLTLGKGTADEITITATQLKALLALLA